jgi:hypothetical protein
MTQRPLGQPATLRPVGQPATLRPVGQPATLRPVGQPATLRPDQEIQQVLVVVAHPAARLLRAHRAGPAVHVAVGSVPGGSPTAAGEQA